MFTEDLVLKGNIIEADSKKRTVVANFLQADTLSENGRFYGRKIVEQAAKEAKGLPSFIDHDSNNPMHIVARITQSEMVGEFARAHFKMGTDTTSNEMFTKIKEGLIDSVSIRASGQTRPMKLGEKTVQEVTELELASIDFVSFSGVPSAKVVDVMEAKSDKKESEFQLAAHAYKRMAELKSDKEKMYVRELIFDRNDNFIEGKNSIEAINHEVNCFKAICAVLIAEGRKAEPENELIIEAIDARLAREQAERNFGSVDQFLESRQVADAEKVKLLFEMMGGLNGKYNNIESAKKEPS